MGCTPRSWDTYPFLVVHTSLIPCASRRISRNGLKCCFRSSDRVDRQNNNVASGELCAVLLW